MKAIVNSWTNEVLYSGEYESTKELLVSAIKSDTNLRGANLSGANLSGADLRGANLRGANLRNADLECVKEDIYKVLESSPAEVPGLLAALREGRINGTAYDGECACLVGTLDNVRRASCPDSVVRLPRDSDRPCEKWFLAIMPW